MKQRWKTAVSICAVFLIFVLLLQGTSILLQPKYSTNFVEGGMLSQYYRENKNHDVVFIGDCEVYSNFSPLEMYRHQGITSYVRGSSQQLIWQSYYILRETFSYERPKIVVYNVNAMRYNQPVSEAYNRMTIDKMKWSQDKIGIIQASMTEEESFLSYVFPILRYHSRFDELTEEDITYFSKTKDNTWNGYLINKAVKPVEQLPAKRILADYQFADICYQYLDRIRVLCEENNAELILIKAPSVYPYWYEEYDAQIQDYANTYGLSYYNLVDHAEEIGLDYQTDTYDGGLHLNLTGAEKLSTYFSDILVENHGAADHRNDPEVKLEYEQKLDRYDAACKE